MNAIPILTPDSSSRPSSAQSNTVAGFGRPPLRDWFDAADLRAIGVAFGFAVGLVLAVTLAGDAYLIGLARQVPTTFDGVAGHQLAVDLLPWAGAFTAIVLVGTGVAAWLCRILQCADLAAGRFGRSARTRPRPTWSGQPLAEA